ncbi:MAG: FecR domain-containing protein [Saprospiraceae bacterium]|nr:FecR domain-containing protein [Saprospiraceae bacterium]MCB9322669.1 FecR domain-containing protein [Lewinellaceae bacterium]
MSTKKNKHLQNWIDHSPEISSKDVEALWNLSGGYKSGYQPDVEGGLSSLKSRMHKPEKTSKVVSITSSRRYFLRAAAAIALILTVAIGWKTIFQDHSLSDITAFNEQKDIFLQDGTIVTLNQNSQLDYPESFDGKTRVVKLTGEAYFKVAHNPAQPFVIETQESRVQVLGTSFNLRAYPGENFTEVEVETGKVEFKPKGSSKSIQLTAREKGIYNHGQKLEKRPAPFTNAQAWRTGELVFKELPLIEAVSLIQRKFKVEIELPVELNQCTFTSNFDAQTSIEEVFEAIKKILPVEIMEKSTGRYLISGKACR